MRKISIVFLFMTCLAVLITNCNIDPGIAGSPSSSLGSSSSAGGSSSAGILSNGIFSFFSDTFKTSVYWDSDTRLDVWEDPENGNILTLNVADQTNSTGEGGKAWKIDGLAQTIYWIGMGIRVEPLSALRDMSAYSNGSLNFLFRGTRPFKLGLKDGNGEQQWVRPLRLSCYGLQTNDAWCSVSVPLKVFDRIDFTKIEQYFMWTADASMGYTTNRAYYLDHVYWCDTFTGVMDSFVETNFGIFSETVESSVSLGYDIEIAIWNDGYNSGGLTLENDPDDYGEGVKSWKLTGTRSWMGFSLYPLPSGNTRDMRAYTNGAVHFMYKGEKPFTKFGIESGGNRQVWVTGADLALNYGLQTNGSWCSVSVPVSVFVAGGIDLSAISQYFMWVQTAASGYVVGDSYRLDNIYWSKF